MAEEEVHGCVKSLTGGHGQHNECVAPACYHLDGHKEGEGEEAQVLQLLEAD